MKAAPTGIGINIERTFKMLQRIVTAVITLAVSGINVAAPGCCTPDAEE